MSSNVEQVKERLSIEEVVGGYVTLKPAGSNLKGVCPFHAEKTPSFVVSPHRQTYHCFGCGVGGDIFSFIEAIEGLDFRGALKMLADKAGVVLTNDSATKKEPTDALYEILEAATVYYVSEFAKTPEALAYLQKRGVYKETVRDFRIGFAPDSWSGVKEHLEGLGFARADIEKAGLIKQGDKGVYDRFRSRIMFPICDSVGRTVAFSGRHLALASAKHKSDVEPAKYINSPETALYHKSKILFGYDRARQSIRKHDFAILVEGQMDVVMTHQAKYPNTVALSGTALTDTHLTLLERMSHNLVMALDADAAGIASAGKSARAALRRGFDVKVAALPKGADPADLLSGGDVSAWKKCIKESKHVIDFLLEYYRENTATDRAFKQQVEEEVLPYVRDIESAIDASHFISRIAAQLTVPEDAVRIEVAKIPHEAERTTHTVITEHSKMPDKGSMPLEEELVLMYLWQRDLNEPLVDIARLKEQVEAAVTPIGFKALEERLIDHTAAAFRFELLYKTEDDIKSAVLELLERLDRRRINEDIEKVGAQLRKAESEGNKEALKKYEKEYQELVDRRLHLEHRT